MKITMTAIIERQRARLYTQKAKKNCETFLYTKSWTLFKKQDNCRNGFIYKMANTLCYAIFHEMFEFGIYIQEA